MVSQRALPIAAAVAAAVAALAILSWLVMDFSAGPPDALTLLVYIAALTTAVFLFLEKTPLGISMGVVLVLVTLVAAFLFIGEITFEDGDSISTSDSFVMQYPFSAGVGILAGVMLLIARWDEMDPRWLWAVTLGVSWFAYVTLFVVRDDGDGAGGFAAVPALLTLGAAALHGLAARDA